MCGDVARYSEIQGDIGRCGERSWPLLELVQRPVSPYISLHLPVSPYISPYISLHLRLQLLELLERQDHVRRAHRAARRQRTWLGPGLGLGLGLRLG